MHTISILAGGLAVLAVFCAAGWLWKRWAGVRRAAAFFVPVWLVLALTNMWIGVTRAGYTVAQELPILVVNLAVPLLAAWIVYRRSGN